MWWSGDTYSPPTLHTHAVLTSTVSSQPSSRIVPASSITSPHSIPTYLTPYPASSNQTINKPSNKTTHPIQSNLPYLTSPPASHHPPRRHTLPSHISSHTAPTSHVRAVRERVGRAPGYLRACCSAVHQRRFVRLAVRHRAVHALNSAAAVVSGTSSHRIGFGGWYIGCG